MWHCTRPSLQYRPYRASLARNRCSLEQGYGGCGAEWRSGAEQRDESRPAPASRSRRATRKFPPGSPAQELPSRLGNSPSRSTAGVAGVTGTSSAFSAYVSKGKPGPAADSSGFRILLRDVPLMLAAIMSVPERGTRHWHQRINKQRRNSYRMPLSRHNTRDPPRKHARVRRDDFWSPRVTFPLRAPRGT
jgi:hypothetical protein